MKTTVRKHQFIENEILADNFSYSGRQALWEYFEEFEEQTGDEIEFDPVAIRCEFFDYGSIKEIKGDYPVIEDLEDLYNYTTVIPHENGIIIQEF